MTSSVFLSDSPIFSSSSSSSSTSFSSTFSSFFFSSSSFGSAGGAYTNEKKHAKASHFSKWIFASIRGGLWVFNSTFNTISFISWRSVFWVEETEVPGEKPGPVWRTSLFLPGVPNLMINWISPSKSLTV